MVIVMEALKAQLKARYNLLYRANIRAHRHMLEAQSDERKQVLCRRKAELKARMAEVSQTLQTIKRLEK